MSTSGHDSVAPDLLQFTVQPEPGCAACVWCVIRHKDRAQAGLGPPEAQSHSTASAPNRAHNERVHSVKAARARASAPTRPPRRHSAVPPHTQHGHTSTPDRNPP